MNNMTREEYIEFMYDKNNIFNCKDCPRNEPSCNYQNLPCGQQNCWVAIHVEHEELADS